MKTMRKIHIPGAGMFEMPSNGRHNPMTGNLEGAEFGDPDPMPTWVPWAIGGGVIGALALTWLLARSAE